MKKILYIVGPTATGKTSLALTIAGKLGGDLISADSRQIYTGMDIGTGKDIPAGYTEKTIAIESKKFAVYQNDHISIWGYDLVNPDKEFSIAHFHSYAHAVIKKVHRQGKLPIIVGGTGLYLSSIESPPDSLSIPHNKSLRKELSHLSVSDLKGRLNILDSHKLASMNNSDANNPRRLVRAIEISSSGVGYEKSTNTGKFDSLWIGLRSSISSIDKNIESRVESRIKEGFGEEFETLYKKGFMNRDFQASSSTGYRQWLDYYLGNISKEEAKKNWITAESQYARRQLTWFKKQQNINWYDVGNKNLIKSVVDFVRVWYS